MSSVGTNLREDVRQLLSEYGKIVKFTYLNSYENEDSYDDDIDLFTSGTTWTSGLVFPINGEKGSNEAALLEQGKILNNDLNLYVLGNINTSGIWRIGIGSPAIGEWAPIPNFVQSYEVGGEIVYKQIFIRKLTQDKYIGEG